MEVVLLEVVGDPLTEHSSLRIGGAEVDASPHSSVDNLIERIGEPLKAPRRAGFVAERAESNPVRAEEVLERVHECTGRTGVSRGVFGEGRREEREKRVADWRRGVKQRQPRRVGFGVRVVLVSEASSLTSLKSSAYSALVRELGPSVRSISAFGTMNGSTFPTHAAGSLRKFGGVGRQMPGGTGDGYGVGVGPNLPSF